VAFTGYNIYRGLGGLQDVDFTATVGTVTGAGATKTLTGLGHLANSRYTYVVRPVYDDLECPDLSCMIQLETDSAGDWVGNRPLRPDYLEAEVIDDGDIRLRWHYTSNATAPATFSIWYASAPNIDTSGAADATEAYTADCDYSKTLTLSGGNTYWIAIAATTAGSVDSRVIEIGPFLTDSTGPQTPSLIATAVFA